MKGTSLVKKSKFIILGIFGIWFIGIVSAFFFYSVSYDPSFGTTKNVVYRHQARGVIKDRNGEVLVYGNSPRRYRLGPAGSPIIGWANQEIGLEGYIEQKYSEQLISNKKSKFWYLLNQSEEGYSLTTTLDRNIQVVAYNAFIRNKGAIVILKLNGEILASVSLPTYDPNKLTKTYYSALAKSPDKPLFNRAFDGRYEPGSTWKTVIAMLLLEKNSKGKPVNCTGSMIVGNKEIGCMKAHGLVKNMASAYTASCNIWFMKNALDLNPDELRDSFKKVTGREIKDKLSEEDVALMAIGQRGGVSPLELASLAASIGNQGMKPVPHVVKTSTEATKVMEKKTAAGLSEMMVDVVRHGTAQGLAEYLKRGYFIAAKTGTAEKDTPQGKTNNAILIGLAGKSKNKPDIAFAVLVEDTHGYGGTVCVPIMKQILDYYFTSGKK